MLACFFVGCPVIAYTRPQKINHSKTQKKLSSTRMRNTLLKSWVFVKKNDKSFCARWKLWPLKNIAAALNQFRKVFSKVMKNDDAIFFDLLCAQCGQDVFSFKKILWHQLYFSVKFFLIKNTMIWSRNSKLEYF